MAVEQPFEYIPERYLDSTDASAEKEEKPNRLVQTAKEFTNFLFRVELSGEENIRKIPAGKKVIIAATHISDCDVPIVVGTLGEHYKNLSVARQSNHFSFKGDSLSYVLNKITGKENALSVSYSKEKELTDRRGKFEPNDFEPIKESLEKGNPVVIAAHSPNYKYKWQLPPKGGKGIAYLSQAIDDVVILPVSVDIQTEKPVGYSNEKLKGLSKLIIKKPRTAVRIGEPFEIPKGVDVSRMESLMKRESDAQESVYNGQDVRREGLREFKTISKELRQQSGEVMNRLADLLPEGKRGHWGHSE